MEKGYIPADDFSKQALAAKGIIIAKWFYIKVQVIMIKYLYFKNKDIDNANINNKYSEWDFNGKSFMDARAF